jgi:hypothetical protein
MNPTRLINYVGRYLLACIGMMLLCFVAIPSPKKGEKTRIARGQL